MTVRFRFTGRAEGDLGGALGPDRLGSQRGRLAAGRWTWLEQVHGAEVVTVGAPGDHAGAQADAVVTDVPGAVLAVRTADCAPVLLRGEREGGPVVGAAHAGWRGLCSGVLAAAVEEMRRLGARRVSWRLGPCISPSAYEFGDEDLEQLVARFGPSVRSRTTGGAPALDLRAGVRVALDEAGAVAADPEARVPCTVVDPGWFSWRRDRTPARQAALIWVDDGDIPARAPGAGRWSP